MGKSSADRDKQPTTPKTSPVTTPTSPMLDHSFTVQVVMELQKSVGQMDVKIGRLIDDVKEQGSSLDEIKHQASFIKGGMAAAVIFITVIVAAVSWMLSAKWDTVIAAINAINKVSP